MGLFDQFSSVVEWKEFRDDMIFYKWNDDEIKKNSRLIIRPGQDAIFMADGKIEGIFKDEGSYEIESQIIPFLSTLKSFRFGFRNSMRAEVLFVNTKEFVVRWGTANAILIPTPTLPGGLPIRAHGTVNIQVKDYVKLIDGIAGVKQTYCVEDVRLRIVSVLDQLLMKWISKEGKDMFHLQANAFEIANGIREDLDMQLYSIGIGVNNFNIMSFTYPQEVQDMITKAASQSMVGDLNRYSQMSMIDSMAAGKGNGGSNAAVDMAGMMMGMNMAQQMMQNMQQPMMQNTYQQSMYNTQQPMPNSFQQTPQNMQQTSAPSFQFCPGCGNKLDGEYAFCPGCGRKLK